MVQSIGSMKMTGILTGLMNGVACGGIEGYNRGMRNGGTTVGLVCGHCCRWVEGHKGKVVGTVFFPPFLSIF